MMFEIDYCKIIRAMRSVIKSAGINTTEKKTPVQILNVALGQYLQPLLKDYLIVESSLQPSTQER